MTETPFMMRSMVRYLLLLFALIVVGAPGSAATATSAEPYEINAILSLTGGAAFLGKAQQQAFGLIEQIANRNGGIKGRPVKFSIVDDQSNPQTAVQLANAIIAKKVPIFIGSDLTAPCSAIGPLVEKNGPTEYCTSPGINPAPGGTSSPRAPRRAPTASRSCATFANAVGRESA
jgi:branched-chain amino acid transport system substrate-binding protein